MHAPLVACIGLGGNLGDAAATVASAARALDHLPHTRLLRMSRLYRTPAWGVATQPDFINAVASIETALAPRALLDGLLAMERDQGRRRASDGSDRWGPRTLDLDILLYADLVVDEAGLTIPHPRLSQRAFALVPLLEVLPEATIPGVGDARTALAALETSGIEALG